MIKLIQNRIHQNTPWLIILVPPSPLVNFVLKNTIISSEAITKYVSFSKKFQKLPKLVKLIYMEIN